MLLDVYLRFRSEKITGETISLEAYKGNVLLIVNTASKCGFAPQYEELQTLFSRYEDQGFTVLGFPAINLWGRSLEMN